MLGVSGLLGARDKTRTQTSGDLRKTARHDLPMCCGDSTVGDWVRVFRKSLG